MKRKWISMLLTMCIATGTAAYPAGMDKAFASEVPGSGAAVENGVSDTVTADGYRYQVLSDGTVKIVRYSGTAAELVVPDEMEGRKVTGIGEAAFDSCTSLQGVVLPKGLTYIGDYTFAGCSSLEYVQVPESVTYLGEFAFLDCSSLKELSIPKGVEVIRDGTFSGCKGLQGIDIPEGVRRIGEFAFRACSSLKNATLPASMREIAQGAFLGCSSLKKVNYNGSRAQRLKMCIVGSGNQDLMKTTVYYGKSGTSETLAPKKGTVLRSGKDSYQVKGDIAAVAFKKTTGGASSVIIPGHVEINGIIYQVTSVAANALKGNKKVTKVTIRGGGVASIGSGAFDGCSRLGTVIIKSNELKSVGKDAFRGMKATAKIKVPSGKLSQYKKLMKGKGQGNKVTVIKWL